jgi:iron complex outermembrane recepter protein
MYGLDLNAEAILTQRLSLRGGAEFLHAYYTSFPNAPISSVNTTFPYGDTIVSGSAEGHWLIKAPRYDFNVATEYVAPVANGELALTLTYAYTGKFYWEPDNRLVQGAYGLLNGQIKWTSPDKHYYVRAFGNNLFNKQYFDQGTTGATGDLGDAAPGRAFGLAVGVSF